jgi:hypothetical protein
VSSIRVFHGLSAGKTLQPPIFGTGPEVPLPLPELLPELDPLLLPELLPELLPLLEPLLLPELEPLLLPLLLPLELPLLPLLLDVEPLPPPLLLDVEPLPLPVPLPPLLLPLPPPLLDSLSPVPSPWLEEPAAHAPIRAAPTHNDSIARARMREPPPAPFASGGPGAPPAQEARKPSGIRALHPGRP